MLKISSKIKQYYPIGYKATDINSFDEVVSEVSKKNHFYLPVHRYYELVHHCRQYKDWKKEKADLINEVDISFDPTDNKVGRIENVSTKISRVENLAKQIDPMLANYILDYVGDGKSYAYLRQVKNIPCSRDVFYELVREFYWRLSLLIA